MDSIFDGDDASLDLRLVLVPRFPAAAGLSPVLDAILVFDPVN